MKLPVLLTLFLLISFVSAAPVMNDFNEVEYQYVEYGDKILQNCMGVYTSSGFPTLCPDCIAKITIRDTELSENIISSQPMTEYQTGRFEYTLNINGLENGGEYDVRVDCYSPTLQNGSVTSTIRIGKEIINSEDFLESTNGYDFRNTLLYKLATTPLDTLRNMDLLDFLAFFNPVGSIYNTAGIDIIPETLRTAEINAIGTSKDIAGYIAGGLNAFWNLLQWLLLLISDPNEAISVLFYGALSLLVAFTMSNFMFMMSLEVIITLYSFEKAGSNASLFRWGKMWLEMNFKVLKEVFEIVTRMIEIIVLLLEGIFDVITLVGRASPF